jgi:hypothetical protein
MVEEYKLPTALETVPLDYWFPKFVISGVLLISAPSFFTRENPPSVFVCAFFLSLSFMLMSLTRVKPELEAVKYRRFFQWKPLQYSEITECGTFWILGFVRSKQYVMPWGRIYFVLPRDRGFDWRWDTGIILFIRNKAGLSGPRTQNIVAEK